MRIVRSYFDAEIVLSGQCPPQLAGAVLCDLAQLDQEIDILTLPGTPVERHASYRSPVLISRHEPSSTIIVQCPVPGH